MSMPLISKLIFVFSPSPLVLTSSIDAEGDEGEAVEGEEEKEFADCETG